MVDLTLSFDTLSRVDSSARFGFGPHPQILSSLSGPIEVRLASEQPSQSTLDLHVRPLSNVPGTESKLYASKVSEIIKTCIILESNPRTLIQLVLQILVSIKDGDARENRLGRDELLSSMINASTLALLHAGSVPMRGVVCAVAIGLTKSKNTDASYIVSTSTSPATPLSAGGCFAFLFTDPTSSSSAPCVWSNFRLFTSSSSSSSSSSIDEKTILHARSFARDAAKEVWVRIKALVEEGEMPKKPISSPLKGFKAAKKTKVKGNGDDKMSMNVDGQAEDDDDEAKMEI